MITNHKYVLSFCCEQRHIKWGVSRQQPQQQAAEHAMKYDQKEQAHFYNNQGHVVRYNSTIIVDEW